MRLRIVPALIALVVCAFTAPVQAHLELGQIWVIDLVNSKVYFVDPDNGFTFNEVPLATAKANNPGALGFNIHGHMLLANFGDDTVVELDGLGGFQTVLTAADGIDGPWGPSGVAIGPGSGDVYITNVNSNTILRFDSHYNNGTVFADTSDGLQNPTGIAFLADGDMLVSDRGGTRTIHHFDVTTGVESVFDVLPDVPVDLVIRSNGDVYALGTTGTLYRYIGGQAANRVVLGNYGASVTGGMDFSSDESVIYHVSTADASIREIDPDTGAAVVRVTLPGSPISLAVVGSQYAPGTYANIGDALAGTGSIEPTLTGAPPPIIGQATQIDVQQFIGGATVFLFLSTTTIETIFKGGEFQIGLGPTTSLFTLTANGTPGAAGAGSITLPFVMPNDPLLVGSKWYLQALGVDAAAPFGVSFSPGMLMYVGQ